MQTGGLNRVGLICLALALAFGLAAIPLRAVEKAVVVGGFSLLDGAALGTILAMATRTRRPLFIYGWLMAACLTLWPLWSAWPPASPSDVTLWPNAPPLLENYLDMLRFFLFALGFPYPFGRLGHHAPDI